MAATPGRLLDMIDRNIIELTDIRVVCLDEAD
jgi:superfamily II DNA/RNA helicase